MSFVCELCGKVTDKAYVVIIDGAEFIVCENCKKYGSIKKVLLSSSKVNKHEEKIKKQKQSPTSRKLNLEEISIIPNYGELIRKEREKRKLKIEDIAKKLGISESYLRRIEQQKVIPDEKTLEKLEEFFGISLRSSIEEFDIKVSEQDIPYSVTLGDFIKIEDEAKKKKR